MGGQGTGWCTASTAPVLIQPSRLIRKPCPVRAFPLRIIPDTPGMLRGSQLLRGGVSPNSRVTSVFRRSEEQRHTGRRPRAVEPSYI